MMLEVSAILPTVAQNKKDFKETVVSGQLSLETTRPGRLHPACVVGDACREHPAVLLEAFANQGLTARFEMFNDHE